MAGPRTHRVLWGVAAIFVTLLVAKFFVADVYRIKSGSMRPTLFGGVEPDGSTGPTDWVLVRYGRPTLARFDLVVLRSREGSGPVVKRVVGLPGESIQIVAGDLLVDGRRLGPDAPRPGPVAVFDDRYLDVEEFFHLGLEVPWRREGNTWLLDAVGIPTGSNQGVMLYQPDLRDDHLEPWGQFVAGVLQANDAVLRCEFSLESPQPAILRFLLMEAGDTFEVVLAPDPDGGGTHTMRLLHRSVRSMRGDPDQREAELARVSIALAPDRWHRFRFANIDNHLTAELPDRGVALRHSYAANEPLETSGGDRSRGHRVGLGGTGGRARFRSIRILRDLHYSSAGEHAIRAPLPLGPDEVFLLGDHSALSQDSRSFGPVRLAELIGRPVAIVWPPARIGSLDQAP